LPTYDSSGTAPINDPAFYQITGCETTLQWSERLLVNLQHQVQYDYNFTAQKTNNTSYAYGLTLAWNSIQTYVRPLFQSHTLSVSLSYDTRCVNVLSTSLNAWRRCGIYARSVSWITAKNA